jgi:hypothetical protein
MESIDWGRIGAALTAPFDPAIVEWRVQGRPKAGKRRQVVAYVSARVVAQRLDDAVGCGNWAFTYTPLVVDGGTLRIAQGRLSVFGVPKEDIGEAGAIEPSLGCVSHTLKRCGTLWGIGRYLYELPAVWATLDAEGKIAEATLQKLREGLERLAAKAAA